MVGINVMFMFGGGVILVDLGGGILDILSVGGIVIFLFVDDIVVGELGMVGFGLFNFNLMSGGVLIVEDDGLLIVGFNLVLLLLFKFGGEVIDDVNVLIEIIGVVFFSVSDGVVNVMLGD